MPTTFEPLPPEERCISPEHNPPMHIVIPPGHKMRHACPACGKETVIIPTQVHWECLSQLYKHIREGIHTSDPGYDISRTPSNMDGTTERCGF